MLNGTGWLITVFLSCSLGFIAYKLACIFDKSARLKKKLHKLHCSIENFTLRIGVLQFHSQAYFTSTAETCSQLFLESRRLIGELEARSKAIDDCIKDGSTEALEIASQLINDSIYYPSKTFISKDHSNLSLELESRLQEIGSYVYSASQYTSGSIYKRKSSGTIDNLKKIGILSAISGVDCTRKTSTIIKTNIEMNGYPQFIVK